MFVGWSMEMKGKGKSWGLEIIVSEDEVIFLVNINDGGFVEKDRWIMLCSLFEEI